VQRDGESDNQRDRSERQEKELGREIEEIETGERDRIERGEETGQRHKVGGNIK
jgi:hypothetical protein